MIASACVYLSGAFAFVLHNFLINSFSPIAHDVTERAIGGVRPSRVPRSAYVGELDSTRRDEYSWQYPSLAQVWHSWNRYQCTRAAVCMHYTESRDRDDAFNESKTDTQTVRDRQTKDVYSNPYFVFYAV